MTSFSTLLEGSILVRPLLRVSQVRAEDIRRWFNGSFLAKTLQGPRAILSGIGGILPQPGTKAQYGLLAGVGLLFVVLTQFDTGPIGALVWLLLATTLLVGGVFSRSGPKFQPTIIDGLVLLFFLSAVVSTAFSSYVPTSITGLGKMMTFLAGYTMFRLILSRTRPDLGNRPLYLLLGAMAALGLAESLIGFYQYINHIQPLATWEDPSINPELKMTRIFGTLKPSNPNLLAGFLIPCLAAAGGLGLVGLTSNKKLWAGGAFLASLAIMAALVLTGSRGGYLAIGGMLLTVFAFCGHLLWHQPGLKERKIYKATWLVLLLGSLAAIGGAIAVSPQIQHRVASIFAMREDSSTSYRLNVYSSAFQMAKDNPVFGIGPGNGTFKLVYGLYMVPGYNALGSYSVPLEIAVEQGLVGLLIFLTLLGALKLRTCLFLDSTRPLSEKLLMIGLFTGVVGSFIYGFFDTIWYRPSVNLLFWFLVAALSTLSEEMFSPSTANKQLEGGER